MKYLYFLYTEKLIFVLENLPSYFTEMSDKGIDVEQRNPFYLSYKSII